MSNFSETEGVPVVAGWFGGFAAGRRLSLLSLYSLFVLCRALAFYGHET